MQILIHRCGRGQRRCRSHKSQAVPPAARPVGQPRSSCPHAPALISKAKVLSKPQEYNHNKSYEQSTTPREVNAVRVPRKGCRTPGPLACPVFKAHFGDRDFPGPHMSGAEPPKDGGQRLFMTRPAQHSLANPPRPGDRSPAAQISPYLLESDMGTRSSHAGLFANLETKCPL